MKNKKANIIQITVHPSPQSYHPDSVVEVDEPVSDSPLFTLASVSTELLKASSLEPASPSAQGTGHEEQDPSIDLESPSKELSPPQDSKFPTEPFTLNQQTIDRLTQELT